MEEPRDPGAEHLEKLSAELAARGVPCRLVTEGCAPRLRLDIPCLGRWEDASFEDNVLASQSPDGQWRFWWPWIQPIGFADDVAGVADVLADEISPGPPPHGASQAAMTGRNAASSAGEVVPLAGSRAGPLMRMVAAGLTAATPGGFPPWSEDGRFLAITGLENMRCQVTLTDDGEALFEWWPAAEGGADPARMAALILKVLGEDREGWRPEWRHYSGLTFKGIVGRALKDSGLDVGMAVYEDPHNYEVSADVVVTSAAHPERGKARFNDDGMLTWEWESRAGASTAEAADRIVSVITSIIPGAGHA